MEAAGPKPAGPSTLIDGTDGLTDIVGALILGPRDGADESLTDIMGISGVTEMEGALMSRPLFGAGDSLTEILGIGGVTPIEGVTMLEARPVRGLTGIDDVSETEIVGRGAFEAVVERVGGAW